MRVVTILNCGHGNLASVRNALESLGERVEITGDPGRVRHAAILVFPGQGAAPAGMRSLSASGLGEAVLEAVRLGIPTLGICLGMQLALERSLEGPTDCLGLIPGECMVFQPAAGNKVPQIGWNTVRHEGNPLFDAIGQDSYFYFAHSYFCHPQTGIIARTKYGLEYASAVETGRFWGTQFHPEKSGTTGLRLLANFLSLAR